MHARHCRKISAKDEQRLCGLRQRGPMKHRDIVAA